MTFARVLCIDFDYRLPPDFRSTQLFLRPPTNRWNHRIYCDIREMRSRQKEPAQQARVSSVLEKYSSTDERRATGNVDMTRPAPEIFRSC